MICQKTRDHIKNYYCIETWSLGFDLALNWVKGTLGFRINWIGLKDGGLGYFKKKLKNWGCAWAYASPHIAPITTFKLHLLKIWISNTKLINSSINSISDKVETKTSSVVEQKNSKKLIPSIHVFFIFLLSD